MKSYLQDRFLLQVISKYLIPIIYNQDKLGKTAKEVIDCFLTNNNIFTDP
jgi:hypothetical protein